MKAHLGHFEIPARRPEDAADFFRRVFGWRAEAVAWDGPEYWKLRSTSARAEGVEGGILAADGAGFDRPLPVLHLSEGSIEECLARVEAAGGSVEERPRRVGEFGLFARFRDPEGHDWGVWSSDR